MTTTNRARALSTLTVIAAAVLLVACGGGEFIDTAKTPTSIGGDNTAIGTPASGEVGVNVPKENFAITPIASTSTGATPDAKKFALAAQQTSTGPASPYGAASPADAIEQLLNFGEATYSVYFPKHKETLTFQAYRYRYYEETGVYLGVADGTNDTVEAGVYVMGGAFGATPTLVGQLTDFITPYAVLHYTDKVYALWKMQFPYAVTKNSDGTFSVDKVKNVSQYQTGFAPLANCGLYNRPLDDGRVLANCTTAVDTKRRFFAINPLKQEMDEYLGNVPEPLTSSNWIFVQAWDPDKPDWGAKVKVSDGWYYTPATQTSKLLHQATDGSVAVVKEGTFLVDGDIAALTAFSK